MPPLLSFYYCRLRQKCQRRQAKGSASASDGAGAGPRIPRFSSAAPLCYNGSMKRLDVLVIALVAALSLAPLLLLLRPAARTGVEISQNGVVLYAGALGADARVTTPDGRNTVCIEGGAVIMEAASCPDGACMRQGRATALRPIVCLPNGVVVRLIGEEAALDAIAG